MPKYLQGLCKRREGDYRILYWPDSRKKVIKIYSVIHRREDYKSIR
jgi:mRNA-degrading endonuclease RelE of RelBE toxin-antitoxin system